MSSSQPATPTSAPAPTQPNSLADTLTDLLREPELSDAIAQVIVSHLQTTGAIAPPATVVHTRTTYRYGALTSLRRILGAIAFLLLLLCGRNTFQAFQLMPGDHPVGAILSLGSIGSGLGLIILLVLEVFLGAGQEVEIERMEGDRRRYDYAFTPAINRLPLVLMLLSIGFSAIILGFSSLYSDLIRQDPSHFVGLESGIVAIYFAFVTFSTVGFGDIHAASPIARMAVTGEIAIAMFFSLVVLSTTLSWITAYERQQHENFIQQRVKGLQSQSSPQDERRPLSQSSED
jgi:hypothetical protein